MADDIFAKRWHILYNPKPVSGSLKQQFFGYAASHETRPQPVILQKKHFERFYFCRPTA
jgi:hypothetical protein